MRNLPEWPVAFFASVLIGAIATPLNAWWTAEELAHALQDSGARGIIVDGERLRRLNQLGSEVRTALVYSVRASSAEPEDATTLESILGPTSAWSELPVGTMPDVALAPEDPATLFYTSGTSAQPKGVLGSHRNSGTNILAFAWSTASMLLRAGKGLDALAGGAQTASLVSIPFFHTTGCQSVLITGLALGGKLVLMHRFEPEAALRLIEGEGITVAGGVPAVASQLLQQAAREGVTLPGLGSLSFGGAAAAPDIVKRIRNLAPNAMPATGWGMTETTAVTIHHMGEDYVRHPESCGRLIPVCEARIVDEAGEWLPDGDVGELWVTGPNVAKGYWNRPEETAEAFIDGWVRTGDLARRDAEGRFYIVGRAKDLIIRGGENIAPVEVENVLHGCPGVAEAAVVGCADAILGEVPAAAVVMEPGAVFDETVLRQACAAKLAAYKAPVRYVKLDDPLPRNAAGKVLKDEVRQLI